MKGYIYLITNTINGKKYVGQTVFSLEKRWKEHLEEVGRERFLNRPLYRAIKKYGKEFFQISLIEECSYENMGDRERYWISFYKSYGAGYNATMGGEGNLTIDRAELLSLYKETGNLSEIFRLKGWDPGQTSSILKELGIEVKWKQPHSITVCAIDPKTGITVKCFPSYTHAGRWLQEERKTKIKVARKISYVISRAARGLDNRKTAYGYRWKNDDGPP